MQRVKVALLAAAAVTLLVGPRAAADGVIRDGLGARCSGRGGTNIAWADNGAILLDNPAGMAHAWGSELIEVGADVLFTDLHYADPDNPRTAADNDPFPAGQVTLVRKTPDGRGAWGLGLFAPAGFSAEYDLEGPVPLAGTRHYKSLGMLMHMLPGAAYRVTDRLAIGGTLGVAVNHMELEGPYIFQSLPVRGTPLMLDLQTTGAALSWSAGLQYRLTECTQLGLRYQDETRFQLAGNAAVFVPGLGDTRFDATLDTVWPRSVGLGVAHAIDSCTVLSTDVIWFDWSHAFNFFDLRLEDPTSPIYQAVVGNRVDERFPLDWHDTVSVRVGYQKYLGPQQVVRAGYIYHRNPIPDETLTPYIQATLQHAFTVGYGWMYRQYEVDLAYQYSFGRDRSVGTSQFVGGDFDNSLSESQVHWLFFSLMQRF